MNAAQGREIIGIIANAPWPGSISADALKIYRMAISDLDFDPSMRAVKKLVRTSQYRPTPAEFRAAVAVLVLPPLPSLEEALSQANEFFAYRQNCTFVNGSGYKPVPPHVHPVVESVCATMGDNSHSSWVAIFTKNYLRASEDRIAKFVATDHSDPEDQN